MLILLLSRTFVRTYGILKQYAMRLCNGKKRIDKYNNGADKHSMRGRQKKILKIEIMKIMMKMKSIIVVIQIQIHG